MSKEDRSWLLFCSVTDGNWRSHLKDATLLDLRYVLRNWGSRGITGRRQIEARIRRLERKRVREFSKTSLRLGRAVKAAGKKLDEFAKAARESGLSMKIIVSKKDDE